MRTTPGVSMDVEQFLRTVVTTDEGYFCLSLKSSTGFENVWFRWPDDVSKILETAMLAAPKVDVFFSPHLFEERDAHKQFALPTRTICVDLDGADPHYLPLSPTVLVQTSKHSIEQVHHHGYWTLSESVSGPDHEFLSKRLTYAIDMADLSGWPLGHKFRLPSTLNHKYEPPQPVSIVMTSSRHYTASDFGVLPAPESIPTVEYDEFISSTPVSDIGPQELLDSIKEKIPAKVYVQYGITMADRSAALFALMCAAFRAGLTRQQVFFLAYHSANNKFLNAPNGLRDLAKDVLRAERKSTSPIDNCRDAILVLRHSPARHDDRSRIVLQAVLKMMHGLGRFVATDDDNVWYIPNDSGAPIRVSRASERLQTFLDVTFGINPSEYESRYVMAGLASHGKTLPKTGISAQLFYFDEPSNSVYVHTGRKDVIRISAERIDTVINGTDDIVFPWLLNCEPFYPTMPDETSVSCWADSLFASSVSNVTNLPRGHAYVLLKTWFLFSIFRTAAKTRPLLGLLGQPGSGKTTLCTKIYALLYGRYIDLETISNAENFDMALASYPIVIFDGVDTYQPWLPDRLSLAAKNSAQTRRKLYTDTDTITLRGQALLGLTAMEFKMNRPDIVDRMLVLQFERLSNFGSEWALVSDVYARRNDLWGFLIRDIQTILQTERPQEKSTDLRTADLVSFGRWFCKALGGSDDFEAAVSKLVSAQQIQALSSDRLLLEALQHYTKNHKYDNEFRSAGRLWLDLCVLGDTGAFIRKYKNAQNFERILWLLTPALRTIYTIEWRDVGAIREWRIAANAE